MVQTGPSRDSCYPNSSFPARRSGGPAGAGGEGGAAAVRVGPLVPPPHAGEGHGPGLLHVHEQAAAARNHDQRRPHHQVLQDLRRDVRWTLLQVSSSLCFCLGAFAFRMNSWTRDALEAN